MNIDYNYMLSQKAYQLKQMHQNGSFKKINELTIEEYDNATVLPIKRFPEDRYALGRGGVVDSENNYVALSALNKRIYDMYPSESSYESKTVVFCGWYVNHWGHFLVDTVIRLWHRPEDVDGFVFIVNENEDLRIAGNFKRFFELLGIPLEKVILVNCPTRFKKVIVPQSSYSRSEYYSDEYINLFQTVSVAALETIGRKKPFEKIFFSRAALRKAKMHEFNINEVDSFFEKNGYKIIYPEKITLDEMIFYLQGCKVCAAVSGTLPHNILFAQNGKKIIISERNVVNNEIQVDVNIIKDLNVVYIDSSVGVFPVDVSSGPFILGYTEFMDRFAVDNNMIRIKSKLDNPLIFRHILKKYLNDYFYIERIYPPDWIAKDNSSIIKQAYDNSLSRYNFLSVRHVLQKKLIQIMIGQK